MLGPAGLHPATLAALQLLCEVAPGKASLWHHRPQAPWDPAAPNGCDCTRRVGRCFFLGLSVVVEPPKCVSQATGQRVDSATVWAIKLVMGLALPQGALRGLS